MFFSCLFYCYCFILVASYVQGNAVEDELGSEGLDGATDGRVGLFLERELLAASQVGQRAEALGDDGEGAAIAEGGEGAREHLHHVRPRGVKLVAEAALDRREYLVQERRRLVVGARQVVDEQLDVDLDALLEQRDHGVARRGLDELVVRDEQLHGGAKEVRQVEHGRRLVEPIERLVGRDQQLQPLAQHFGILVGRHVVQCLYIYTYRVR